MSQPGPADDRFRLAWELMDEADQISSSAFASRKYRVKVKADGSPVTDVDLAIERIMIEGIQGTFSDDAILAEESGGAASPGGQWILDPLDGTGNFLEQVPVYAHMTARMGQQGTRFAIVSAPGLQRRWWAYDGYGAYQQDRPIAVSATSRIDRARICYGGLRDYEGQAAAQLVGLIRRCLRSRAFGNFLPHMLVAEGRYDLASSGGGGESWDVVPLALIVEAAGGKLTSLSGRPWHRFEPVLTTNSLLHAAALQCFGCPRSRGSSGNRQSDGTGLPEN